MADEPRAARSRAIDRRVELAREWDRLVGRVRSIGPEFADFLGPPRLKTLLPAVGTGTAALINVTRQRCDALLVTASGVRAVALPGLTAQETVDRALAHVARLQAVDEATDRILHSGRRARVRPVFANVQAHHTAKLALRAAEDDLDAQLLGDLRWMWEVIAEPVLDAAGSARIWWCPTGPLSLLPLHAAGHHDGSGRSVLDRVVSSYTPTLRALAGARGAPSGGDGRMLAVAVDGDPPLPQTAVELELLRDLFPAGRLTIVEGEEATRERVLTELARHRWAHFSCHGRQDILDPSSGGLLLADGALTVADLGRGSFEGGFAFLSACMTATGGLSLSEEAITLGAGLHYAGFQNVLATLWSVDAEIATELAHEIFPALVVDGRLDQSRSAEAANDAIRNLRDAEPGRPGRWAPLTHTGP